MGFLSVSEPQKCNSNIKIATFVNVSLDFYQYLYKFFCLSHIRMLIRLVKHYNGTSNIVYNYLFFYIEKKNGFKY